MPKQTFKKWRIGLYITVIVALCATLAGLTTDMNWKQFLALFGSTMGTGFTTYLMKSPLTDVEDNV